MWDTFILNPMVNALIWLYGLMGHSIILAILVLTIIIRLITLPLTLQSQKSMQATQRIQPKIEELRKKYKDDPETLNREMMEIYKREGVNPVGGCLPMLIQFPILIGLYQAITRALAASPIDLLRLSGHVYDPAPAFLAFLPSAHDLIPLNNHFFWLNLAQPDQFYVLPVLVVITTFLQNKLMTPPASGDSAQAAMGRQMQFMMPLMIGWFSLNFPSGLSVYWITSNLVGIAQYAMLGRASLQNLFGTEDGSFSWSGLLGMPTTPPEDKDKAKGRGGSGASSKSSKASQSKSKKQKNQ